MQGITQDLLSATISQASESISSCLMRKVSGKYVVTMEFDVSQGTIVNSHVGMTTREKVKMRSEIARS